MDLPTSVTTAAVGNGVGCAIALDGALYCWGDGATDFFGSAAREAGKRPTQIKNTYGFRQLAFGLKFACGLTNKQQIYCWGNNDNGELGNGSLQSKKRPTRVLMPRTKKFIQIGIYVSHACARTNEPSLLLG